MRRTISPLIVIIGLAVMIYPSVSEYLIEKNASRAVSSYDDTVAALDEETIEASIKAAGAYNRLLMTGEDSDTSVTDDIGNPVTTKSYDHLLSLAGGGGQMGYIIIPVLDETIPIYHGTDNAVMQTGIGHMEGTSLPIGGDSTHAVLAGHRGLPLANLFTNLDQIEIGDTFYLKMLDRTLCYTVDSIDIVLPEKTEGLRIEPGKDYVTLVTCTPYGINSHRLLVRGVRTPYDPSDGEPDKGYTKSLKAFWKRLPMQYRHLIIGISILVLILLAKKQADRIAEKRKK